MLINRNFNNLVHILITLIFYYQIGFVFSQRVKLNDVQTLTLTKGLYTTGRRLVGVPQLKCLGGTAGCKYSPSSVQCYNRGFDGIDINWECKAELDANTKFGNLRVTCEGYDYDTDTYVLAGSCGLEYTIDFRTPTAFYNSYRRDYFETSKLGNFLTLIVMIIIVVAIYKSCTKFHENTAYDPYTAALQNSLLNQYDHEYTGYDSSQFPAPPPPYGFRSTSPTQTQTPQPGFRSEYMQNECGGNGTTVTTPTSTQNQSTIRSSSNPFNGFWAGAATGGIAGYMFGRRLSTDSNRNRSGYDSPPPAYEPDELKLSSGFATSSRR